MLRLPADIRRQMVDHCLAGLPEEACGLLGGTPAPAAATPALAGAADVSVLYPTRNAAASAKLYEVDSRDYLHADRDAEARGLELLGVFHSHTHTEAYPSPTDVAQAPDPTWHYVLVSLQDVEPVVRSYRIVDATIEEEEVVVS